MDKAVVEIINTFALIFLGTMLLSAAFITFYNAQNMNYTILLRNYKEEIVSILEEIYFYKLHYNSTVSIELISEYLISIEAINSSLIKISVSTFNDYITTKINVTGGGIGYYFFFNYYNNEIHIISYNKAVAS